MDLTDRSSILHPSLAASASHTVLACASASLPAGLSRSCCGEHLQMASMYNCCCFSLPTCSTRSNADAATTECTFVSQCRRECRLALSLLFVISVHCSQPESNAYCEPASNLLLRIPATLDLVVVLDKALVCVNPSFWSTSERERS